MSPSRGFFPDQDFFLQDAATLLTPNQSWGAPKFGGQLSRTPRRISALEKGLGQRAWQEEMPPKLHVEQDTQGFTQMTS